MSWLSRLAERQILKTLASSGLRGLAGEGKPLPQRPEEAFTSQADAAGFRIMAEAGALPEEIVLRKQIEAKRAELADLTDVPARKAALAALADLDMRLAMAVEARRRFLAD